MKITKPGDINHKMFYGTCDLCGCFVEDVTVKDLKLVSISATQPARCLVDCPTDGCPGEIYLSVAMNRSAITKIGGFPDLKAQLTKE
jgi:hypothetical protein